MNNITRLDAKIYLPNRFHLILVLFFLPTIIIIMIYLILSDESINENYNYLKYVLVIIAAFFSLFFFLDVWIVKIEKDKTFIRRPWKKKWKRILNEDFNKVKFKVSYFEDGANFQQLTIFTKDDKKIKFKAWNEKIGKPLYKDLLEQSPELLNDYEKILEKHLKK